MNTEKRFNISAKLVTFIVITEFIITLIFNRLKTVKYFSYIEIFLDALILGIIVNLILNRLLSRPLMKISRAMEQVGRQELGIRLKIEQNDEIGALAVSFNQMAEKLEATIKELELSKIGLSDKVEERTRELFLEKEKIARANLELTRERTAIINMLEDMDEMNKNLSRTQEQLVQSAKMASIGQLSAGLAHEINNPLTGVLNNVQLIKMMMEQEGGSFMSDAEFKELLNIIEESATRCKNITQSLLDFSHISKVYTNRLSVNELIEKVGNLVAYELRLQNITLRTELSPDLPLIQGNPQLLQQVFMNLVTNARWAIKKKAQEKGGLITIKTEYQPQNNRIAVYVSDTGVGMSDEVKKRIFEPFFTTKDVGEGTGLGLSVIYGIVKEHKGAIQVESKVNEGTTFKIYLPVEG